MRDHSYTFTFLGTGTSTGVPALRCHCGTCVSPDPRDKRLRCSGLVHIGGRHILIDAGPDLRQQLLRWDSPAVDALLVTHTHYDHVGGIDDLRPYCYHRPEGDRFPVYCRHDVAEDLRHRVPYCFVRHPYPGVPTFDLRLVREGEWADVCGIPVLPIGVMHARLPILGFKIGGRLAYVTDCKVMPPQTVEALRGIDTLVLNALRPQPHMSHLCLDEALALVEEINPGRAYLTHMSHDMPPQGEWEPMLPPRVHAAYDGLVIEG